jgi:hypothetical protein
MKLIPERPTHTKMAILSVINSIVSLFILIRMSKCQKNKYFNVGSQPCKTANPEFQGSLSKLLAERGRQDSLLASCEAKVSCKTKSSDIDLILGNFTKK